MVCQEASASKLVNAVRPVLSSYTEESINAMCNFLSHAKDLLFSDEIIYFFDGKKSSIVKLLYLFYQSALEKGITLKPQQCSKNGAQKNPLIFPSSHAKVIIFYTYLGLTVPYLKTISYLVKAKKQPLILHINTSKIPAITKSKITALHSTS